jgi:hypothetical protein
VWRHVRDDPRCICEDRRAGRGTEALDQARLPLPCAQRRCVRAHHPSPDRTRPVTDVAASRSQPQSITLNVFESVPPPTQPSTRPTTRVAADRFHCNKRRRIKWNMDDNHGPEVLFSQSPATSPPSETPNAEGIHHRAVTAMSSAHSARLLYPRIAAEVVALPKFSCRDGSALAKACVASHIWSERPCVRPFCMTAGTVSWKRSNMLFTEISRPIFQCRGVSSDDRINPWKLLSALA